MDKRTKAFLNRLYHCLSIGEEFTYEKRIQIMTEIFILYGRGGEQLECFYSNNGETLPYLGKNIKVLDED